MTDQSKRFEIVAMPHLSAAYNLARWLVRNEQDAHDIVQEAYLRAFKFFDGFHGENARGWLLAIVRNTAYSWLRKNHEEEPAIPFDEELHSLDEHDPVAPNDPGKNPETILARGDIQRTLNQALEELPLEFREILVLRELEDLSYKEIAHVTGVALGTVMSRLARGRKMLRERLEMNQELCRGL